MLRNVRPILFLLVILSCAWTGCRSRQATTSPDQGASAGDGNDVAAALGFDTPDEALDAYGKALVAGDAVAYRQIAAKDTKAIAQLDAIIQLEADKSPDEAAKINLQAMAPNQGFGDVAAQRFPAEVSGDNAVIVQLFERVIALNKEIHFRRFSFSKSGGKWFLVGSEFGEASSLPAKYVWNKHATTAVAAADLPSKTFIPQDAFAALVVHPRRAASSEIGQSLLQLDVVQAGLEQSPIKPNDIERIIYAMGIPTEESENNCTIVQFASPVSREVLLQAEFGDLPFEEVRFGDHAYYRYADESSPDDGVADQVPARDANEPANVEASNADTSNVLANFPDDYRPAANGHADRSGSGTWQYYSSHTRNPTLPEAKLFRMNWSKDRNYFRSQRGQMGNMNPHLGSGWTVPSGFAPHNTVVRWTSRVSGNVLISGKFERSKEPTVGNGVNVSVYVDGEEKFSSDLTPQGKVDDTFEIPAVVQLNSTVDLVVDSKGNMRGDMTFFSALIESRGEIVGAAPAELVETVEPNMPADDEDSSLLGTTVYFPDDKTLIRTDEQQLRRLLSDPPTESPLTTRLAQLDLDHDLVAVVALEGQNELLAAILNEIARESGAAAELAGLCIMPEFATHAVATFDLSGDTLLSVVVDATNAQAAVEIEIGFESLLDAAEGLRNVIPEDSPLLSLLKELVQGATLQSAESQVVLEVRMPAGLADFVRQDVEAAILSLGDMTAPGGDREPTRDVPADNGAANAPQKVVIREPPQDHPEFRDLAVESHNCRIFFPGEPDFTEDVVPTEDGRVHVANFAGNTARASYMFEIYTYPQATVDKTGAIALLEQTRDNLVDAPTGRLISSKSLTYQDSPAIEFVYQHPDVTADGQAHCRIVIRENRAFIMEVNGTGVPAADIKVFFDSLAPFALPDSTRADSDLPDVSKPKLPVPDQAAHDAALTLVRELYLDDFETATSTAEKIQLAEKMIAHAAEVEAAAERYMLLDVARKMASGAGGVDAVLDALAQLEQDFQIDAVQLSSQSLVELADASLATQDRLRLAGELLNAAQSAVAADRYDIASALFQQAASSARSARDLKLAKQATDQLDQAAELASRFEIVKPALEALNVDPDDADAHLVAGQFFGLAKGHWDVGLAHLAKGSDATLQAAAALDLAGATTAEQQLAIADQWYELAMAADSATEEHLQLRAAFWYRQALPQLSDLQKATVEKRLSDMKYVPTEPKFVFLPDVPMLGAEGVLINDDKGHFREERLKGEKYDQVLWAHAKDNEVSHYAFTLNRKYSQMTGKAAINDVQSVDRALKPQIFAIYGDNRPLWKSRPLQNKLDAQEFSINVSNVRTLHFYVSGGGYGGHALGVDVTLEEKP